MATSNTPLTSGHQSSNPTTAYVHLFSPFPFLLSSSTSPSHPQGTPGKSILSFKLLETILTPARSPPEHEITHIQTTLSKLSDKKLASQRFVPSQEKTENLSKLALGAKLDRALARRMGGQDAVMKVKSNEKISEKVAAN